MIKSIISQIYVAICIFIDSKLNQQFCKSFLKDLLSDNVNEKQLRVMGDSGKLLIKIARNYKESGIVFNSKDASIIIDDLTKNVYATNYYMGIWNNKKLSLQDRQQGKDNLIIRDALCVTIRNYLVDNSKDAEFKQVYKKFKSNFEAYKINTQLIVDMITNNPNDNESIREAIKERTREAKILIDRYGQNFDISEVYLRSVLEDSIIESKKKKYLSKLDKSVLDLIA